SLQYFLRSIERICDPNYCATPEDIIHLQQRTIGLDQNEVVFGDLTIDLVDTGGQKSERRKWIHCFDGADFVVFCVNLAGYDLTLWEDHNDNQMQDALTVWDSLCRSKWLGSSTFILLFNKRDIYEEKILHSDIATHFPVRVLLIVHATNTC
ncbi:inhibitory GTP-binding protein subunit alpha 2, partial [Coniophora puteana RWD-64-598 SS2]